MGRHEPTRTHVQRVYAPGNKEGDEPYWIDIEVVDVITSTGRQFPGLARGNQASQTRVALCNTPGQTGGRGTSAAKVQMEPVKSGEEPGSGPTVSIPVTESMNLKVKNNEEMKRSFCNSRGNATTDRQKMEPGKAKRQITGVIVASNYIDDDLLVEVKGGKAPPSKPSAYREAIRQSDDSASLGLHVALTYAHFIKRGKGVGNQEVANQRCGNPKVKLPGTEPAKKTKDEMVLTDPFKSIINFGPDGLAVEFHLGEGPAKE